jgi:hypothetical protein
MHRGLIMLITNAVLLLTLNGCAGWTAQEGNTTVASQPTVSIVPPSPTPLPPESAILGQWKNNDESLILSFYKDGTIVYSDPDCCRATIGDYRFMDDTHIRVDMGATETKPAYATIIHIKLDGDTLIVSNDFAQKTEQYSRVTEK